MDYQLLLLTKKYNLVAQELEELGNSLGVEETCVEYDKSLNIVNTFAKDKMTKEEFEILLKSNDEKIENMLSLELNSKINSLLSLPIK